MRFLVYHEDTPSTHYTGIVSRGRCVLGVEVLWNPAEDRAIGLVVWDYWVGFCAYPQQ